MSRKLDRMEKKIKDANKANEPSFIRASSIELSMYIECLKAGRPMPEDGSAEFWELFDEVNSRQPGPSCCPRELMQQYLDREPPEIKIPPEVANDRAVKELNKYIEERKAREVVDHILPRSADL